MNNQMTNTHMLMTSLQDQEHGQQEDSSTRITSKSARGYSMPFLVANYACLFIGSVSSSLISKYYFNHGGSSRWVSTWVQSAGFPLLLLPVYLPYYLLRTTSRKPFTRFTRRILTYSILIGLMLGLNNLLFSWGNSYLPVSTSSLLLSTQLIFTLVFSVLIVKQKITFPNLNCVVLLTLSSVLLALGSRRDKPPGLTRLHYFIGYFSIIGAGLLFALYLPVMERLYSKVYCYAMMIEMQLVMEMAATALATVGMVLDRGFSDMAREANQVFDMGPRVYWAVAVGVNVLTWQLCFLGTAGMVYLTTGITSGICMTALMAMNVLGGVVVYGDHFGGVKAVSTALCVWGFCSYMHGMYVKIRNEGSDRRAIREEEADVNCRIDGKAAEVDLQMEMGRINATATAADGRV